MSEPGEKKKVVILVGPPGSGKTSLCTMIEDDFDAGSVETGSLLRSEVERKTDEGRRLEPYLEGGQLAPDDLVTEILAKALGKVDRSLVVLDGYPRHTDQALSFSRLAERLRLELEAVIALELPERTVERRLSGRRICSSNGEVYNVYTDSDEQLAACEGELVQRDDDKPEVVKKRLETYRKETEPVIGYFEAQPGISVFRVQADGPKEDVYGKVAGILRRSERKE